MQQPQQRCGAASPDNMAAARHHLSPTDNVANCRRSSQVVQSICGYQMKCSFGHQVRLSDAGSAEAEARGSRRPLRAFERPCSASIASGSVRCIGERWGSDLQRFQNWGSLKILLIWGSLYNRTNVEFYRGVHGAVAD